MNRIKYFNYIRRKLVALAAEIEISGKLNILDLHAHSENFYLNFFKELFGWDLKNANKIKSNVEAIDLIADTPEKIVIQVSSTCSKEKIESALNKQLIKDHNNYCFKFISISKDASELRKKDYKNPHSITFNPLNDIYDVASILNCISALDIDCQKKIYEFIKKELGDEIDINKLDSNLATVINVLSKEKLEEIEQTPTVDSFEIDRKITFNNLDSAKYIIDDYSVHHNRLDKIYSEFDTSGENKSNSVLSNIRTEYIKNIKIKNDDDLFFIIINNIQDKITQSPNLEQIPTEELELCVNILVVDAFIRCKIFKNPNNYKYATS
jgi:hypothetical protein